MPLRMLFFRASKTVLILACGTTTITSRAQTYDLIRNLPVAPGTVNAMAQKGDTLFIGGQFDYVAEPRSFGTIVSTADGSPDRVADRPDAKVLACVSDGTGGWFVGGTFTSYNDQPRNGLAHMGGDGHLIDWVPDVDPGTVGWAIAVDNGWVFTGGNEVITAVDASTGQNIGWSVAMNGGVQALAVHDGILYVGGNFNMVGTATRSNLAAIDIATGAVTPWNVSCNGIVNCLLPTPDALLVGGAFSTVAGSIRHGVCALDYGTALCTPWNPDAGGGGEVIALASLGTALYLGGNFSTINSTTRASLAAVDITTGDVLDLDVAVGGPVNALCVSEGLLFVGGEYVNFDGQERRFIAAVDIATGLVDPWTTPEPEGPVSALSINGMGQLFIGGDFSTAGGVPRRNVAAISMSTGEVLPWRYDVTNGVVNAMCVAADKLFIGGQFSYIGGQYRPNLGAVDLATDEVSDWAPIPNNRVNAVAVHGSRLYAGGYFDFAVGQSRYRMASFELGSLELTGWNPLLGGFTEVFAFGFHENLAYVGKDPGLIIVDTASSLIMPITPQIDYGTVRCFAERNGTMYFGGSFTEVNGVDRDYAAAMNAATGELTAWDVDAQSGGNEINAMTTNATSVFIGGILISIGGTFDGGVLPVDPISGAAQIDTDVFSQYGVHALLATNSSIYAGGANYNVFHNPRRGLAGYGINDLTTGLQGPSDGETLDDHVWLWPSPNTGGSLHVAWNSDDLDAPLSVDLLDASGRTIGNLRWMGASVDGLMRGTLSGMQELQLATGIYFVRLAFADEVRLVRLAVER